MDTGTWTRQHATGEALAKGFIVCVHWAVASGRPVYVLGNCTCLCSNEAEVGSAVQKSGIPRDEVYITTKVGGVEGGVAQPQRYGRVYLLANAFDKTARNHSVFSFLLQVWNADHGYEATIKACEQSLQKCVVQYAYVVR